MMKQLHISGCHRSGTTLLFEMLSTCFEHTNRCEHEQSIFVDTKMSGEGLYLSKKPSDVTHMNSIFERDPGLFLICVVRDPRAVITSVHPSKKDVYFTSFERWQRYEQAAIKTQFDFLHQTHAFSQFHLHAASSDKAKMSLKGLRPHT